MRGEKPKPRMGAAHPMSLWDPEFLLDKTGIRPIRRKSATPCPKTTCLRVKKEGRPGCHNYDKESTLGYTCLIKGTSPGEPYRVKVCCWYVAIGQLVLGQEGAV